MLPSNWKLRTVHKSSHESNKLLNNFKCLKINNNLKLKKKGTLTAYRTRKINGKNTDFF